jgi:hypothetical protein
MFKTQVRPPLQWCESRPSNLFEELQGRCDLSETRQTEADFCFSACSAALSAAS